MKTMVQRLPALFLLFVFCGNSLIVTGFSRSDLLTVTRYITRTITGNINRQHAYVVKFSEDECRNLSRRVVRRALRNEHPNWIDVFRNENIYQGRNLVLATYKQLGRGQEHAEYRLLYPIGSSPVYILLNRPPTAGCVLFYTLNSPCSRKCLDPASNYNILDGLRTFSRIRNKALVFQKVFSYNSTNEEHEEADNVWTTWERIEQEIPLYRCARGVCQRCFTGNTRNNNCMNRNEANIYQK